MPQELESVGSEAHQCERDGQYKDISWFYKRRDGTPLSICKQCVCENINIDDPKTFLWVLKELDRPFIQEEWDQLKEKNLSSNMLFMGKYLAKMKTFGFRNYTYEDSRELNKRYQEHKRKSEQARLFKIDVIPSPREKDILIMSYPLGEVDVDITREVYNKLIREFPNNKVICIPNDYSLKTMSKEELLFILKPLVKILEENGQN